MSQTNQSIPGNTEVRTQWDIDCHLNQSNNNSVKMNSVVCKCCVHQCCWHSQPKLDAWANRGPPDSFAMGSLAMNCGHLHACSCSFLYEYQCGVLKVHYGYVTTGIVYIRRNIHSTY